MGGRHRAAEGGVFCRAAAADAAQVNEKSQRDSPVAIVRGTSARERVWTSVVHGQRARRARLFRLPRRRGR